MADSRDSGTLLLIPLWGWLVIALCWFSIGTFRPLLDPDEGRYAEIPREMVVSGDWITPRLNGLKYFEKPPLHYWATAAAYSAFGLHEWSARWFALTTTFLCFPLVYFAATYLHRSPDAGLAALVGLAVNPGFVGIGQINILDGAFALFTVGALLAVQCALRSERGSKSEQGWVLLMWVALALAVLTKGLAGPVLAGGTLVAYSALTRDFAPWRRLHWLPGLAVISAIAVPWFAWVAYRNDDFLQFFFVREHFQRFLTTVHHRTGPWWYFLPLLAISVLPWVRQLPAVWRGLFTVRAGLDTQSTSRFLAVWCLVVTVFFSISQSKLLPYIMPALPVLALLLAPQLAAHKRWLRTAGVWSGGLLALVAVGLLGFQWWRGESLSTTLGVSVTITLVCATATAVAVRFSALTQARAAIGIVAASMLGWSSVLLAYTALPPLHTSKPIVAAIRAQVGPHTRLYSIGQYRGSLSAYLGRTMQLVSFRGELDFGLSRTTPDAEMSTEQFLARWPALSEAFAFVSPTWLNAHQELLRTGNIVANDGGTIVVKHQ